MAFASGGLRWRFGVLTGLSSPSSTSSLVKSLKQSLRVTSSELFCKEVRSDQKSAVQHLRSFDCCPGHDTGARRGGGGDSPEPQGWTNPRTGRRRWKCCRRRCRSRCFSTAPQTDLTHNNGVKVDLWSIISQSECVSYPQPCCPPSPSTGSTSVWIFRHR